MEPLLSDIQEQNESKAEYSMLRNIGLLLLLVYFFASPFLNRIQIIKLSALENTLTNMPYSFDIFAAFKSQYVSAFGIVFVLLVLALLFRKDTGAMNKAVVTSLMAFLFMIVLSSLLSPYPQIVMRGVFDRFEGYPVWFSYVFSFVLAMLCFRNIREWKVLKWIIFYLLTVQVLLGISQYAGHNLMNYPPLSNLTVPTPMRELYHLGQLRSGGTAFGSINNPNFYSQFIAVLMAMAAPIVAKGGLYKRFIFTGAGCCLAFAGCSGGLIGLAVGMGILGLWVGTEKREQLLMIGMLSAPFMSSMLMLWMGRTLSAADAIVCALIPIAYAGSLLIRKCIEKIGYRRGGLAAGLSVLLLFSGFFAWILIPDYSAQTVNRIEILENLLVIHYPEGLVTLSTGKGNLISVKDNNGVALIRDIDEGTVEIPDLKDKITIEAFPNYSLVHFERLGAKFVSENNLFYYQEAKATITNSEKKSPYLGFVGKEKFGSGRGYIWSRTLPLLPGVVLVGVGPDVFPFVFPQYDYVGTINMGAANIMIDKPHNWFLQIAVSFGIPALLALLILSSGILRAAWNILANSEGDQRIKITALSAIGIIVVYSVTGLLYDSVISVSMCLWPLMGALVGLMTNLPQQDMDSVIADKDGEQS